MTRWLVLVGIVVSSYAGTAHAGDRLFVGLDAALGGGSVDVMGTRYGTMTGDIGVTGGRWMTSQLGLGVRLASVLYGDSLTMDGHTVSSSSDELELVGFARTVPSSWGGLSGDWVASAGLGAMQRRSDEIECSELFDEHSHCWTVKALERKNLADASAFGGYQVAFHHVTVSAGVRATVESSGARHLGVALAAGAAF